MSDLDVDQNRLRETLDGRYPGMDVFIQVEMDGERGVRVAIWATNGGVFYNQWVYRNADGW